MADLILNPRARRRWRSPDGEILEPGDRFTTTKAAAKDLLARSRDGIPLFLEAQSASAPPRAEDPDPAPREASDSEEGAEA